MLTNKKRIPSLVLSQALILLLSAALVWTLTGCTPAGPRALLKGKSLLESGDLPAAIEQLETAKTLIPTNDLVWNYLGVAYHRAGKFVPAADAYSKALKLNPDLSIVHFNMGCLLLEQNRNDLLEQAQSEFIAYLLRQGRTPEALIKLGTVQLRMAHWQQAEATFKDVLSISPKNAEAFNDLGIAQLQRRHYQDAANSFAAALRLQPGYASALQNFATSQLYVNNRPLALDKFKEYLSLNPRPANWDVVNLQVQQMEREMAPTNPQSKPEPPSAPVQNTAQTAARSNTVVPAQPKPEPQPVVVTKPTPPAPRANPEPVRVVEAPQIKSTPTTEVVTAANPPVTNPPLVDASNVAQNESPAARANGKKNLLQRLNPIGMFSRDQKPATNTNVAPSTVVTPLPETVTIAESLEPRVPVSKPRAITPLSIPNSYPYLANPKPAAGNRAEAEPWYDKGVEARKDRRVRDAINFFVSATQFDPTFFEAQMALGSAALDVGDMSHALRAYEIASALHSDSFNARYGFGLALKKSNYLRESAEELERALATAGPAVSSSQLASAHLALGNLYADQFHRPTSARPHYLKVLELDSNNSQATSIRYWLQSNP